MTRKSTPTTKVEKGKENHHMTPEIEEEEALHMKIEDIGRDLTQEIGGTTMALADLGGEGTAGRVSTSRGLLLQAPLLPRDQ